MLFSPSIDLDAVNLRASSDPEALIRDCEAKYHNDIMDAARRILSRLSISPIVLLSGPSSSGKTTTATLLAEALHSLGVCSHRVSMDDYYMSLDDPRYPRLPDGKPDLESPFGLNIELLHAHMEALSAYQPVDVPCFDFLAHSPDPQKASLLAPKPGDAVIFEGIHALNGMFTDRLPDATRIYVSVSSHFTRGDEIVIMKFWLRFLRRAIRDRAYRGCDFEETLRLWTNVRQGETLYIKPFDEGAHIRIDSTHAYEPGVLLYAAQDLLRALPQDVANRDMVDALLALLPGVTPIDAKLLPETSLLRREFLKSLPANA